MSFTPIVFFLYPFRVFILLTFYFSSAILVRKRAIFHFSIV